MTEPSPAYGLWPLVLLNSAIFIAFAFSFFMPSTARDWRSFGGYAAFVVALFAEMYGFPLTIYLLSGVMYARLARSEERKMARRFGDAWQRYAARTPAFFPAWRRPPAAP